MSRTSWPVFTRRTVPIRTIAHRVTRIIFGDQFGFTLFVGALCFFALFWRTGVWINDNYVVVNTLQGVSQGHLYIDDTALGVSKVEYPGSYSVRGRLYGRNYGHVFVSLPVLWLLEGSAQVVDPRILLVGVWSLGLLLFCQRVGQHIGKRTWGTYIGVFVALTCLVVNVAIATPLGPWLFSLMALQLTTMIAAALTGVMLYRLLSAMYTRRIGLVAGVVTVVATPIGFWATIPKRHIPIAFLAVCTIYSFYRSRSAATIQEETHFRALSYAFIGLSAWVFAPEALALALAVGPIDFLTARSNKPRQLAVIGAVFGLSLVPFLLTNFAISGNPLEPPTLLRKQGGIPLESQPVDGGSTGQTPSGNTGQSPNGNELSVLAVLVQLLGDLLSKTDFITRRFTKGLTVVVTDPMRLISVFVRSGHLPGMQYPLEGYRFVNLALIESVPIIGVLLGAPIVAVRVLRQHGIRDILRRQPAVLMTDLVALSYMVSITLIYIPTLPIHTQITVRYLLSLVPFLVYGVFRLSIIREVCTNGSRMVGWSYHGSLLIGGQLVVIAFLLLKVTLAEAIHIPAVGGLVLAGCLGVWTLAGMRGETRPRLGAILFGMTAAATTLFLVLGSWEYFTVGNQFALPVVRLLAKTLPLL